jgi:hypothetical protein
MVLRLIVAVAVGTAVASGAVAWGQGASAEECVIEPIVIGGTVDGEIVGDGSVVPDALPGDMLIDAPVMTIDTSLDSGIHAPSGCGHAQGCGCAAAPRGYVVFDVLFLDRDNATNNQTILAGGTAGPSPGGTIFTTRSLTPTTAPGVRLFVGEHGHDTTGWEVGYWGVYGWYGDARADLTKGLAVPGAIGAAVPGCCWAAGAATLPH